jgi:hypothetical protein
MTKKIEQGDHNYKSQIKIRRKKKNRMNGTDFAVTDILATFLFFFTPRLPL